MPTVFEKLQWKPGMPVLVLHAPESFLPELAGVVNVSHTLHERSQVPFLLAFVTSSTDVESVACGLTEHLADDGLLWFAFPKLSSKRYRSDLSRDRGWQSLRDLGYDTVRAIAIDEDWSALRFRHGDRIGSSRRLL